MAVLQCKMCGGTMEYDRTQNLAVCPYCGNKSTVFEQDRKLFEQFQGMFAALLNQEKRAEAEDGFWVDASREELLREDGEVIEIAFLAKKKADMCTMYVAKEHVIYVFGKQYADYAERYKKMCGGLRYPDCGMERELSRYVPKLVTECRLADGSSFLAIHKEKGVYPLNMLGILLDRHVAWIVSRLENLCCLLDYNDIALNGLTVDNLFVSPAEHQIFLYGGWWFAGFIGAETAGSSAEVKEYLEKKTHGKSRNSRTTDLESLRLAAAKLLGYPSREKLREDTLLPKAFRDFLTGRPKADARKDFAEWDKALEKSFGERKFIPLSISEEEIYSRSIINEKEGGEK